MSNDQYQFRSERPEPKFYARVPKLIQRMLNPYQLALYTNYKQTAGEDETCYKSTKTLAQETGMSPRKVHSTRDELEALGLIRLERRTFKDTNANDTVIVYVRDVWGINNYVWSKHPNPEKLSPDELLKLFKERISGIPYAPNAEGVMHDMHKGYAPHADKEEPQEVEPKEEKQNDSPATQGGVSSTEEWNDLLAAIGDVFKLEGKAAMNPANMLLGRLKKKSEWQEYNLEQPSNALEVKAFGMWYRRYHPDINIVQAPMKIYSKMLEFRQHHMYESYMERVQPYTPAPPPELPNTITDEEIAGMTEDDYLARLKALSDKMGGAA